MGGALLHGWGKQTSFVVSTLDPIAQDADYQASTDMRTKFDVIVLAVKPQVMAEVSENLKHIVTPSTLILSIAAGKPLVFYEEIFGASQPIVRAMPNTPALVSKGISVLCGNAACSEGQRQLAMNLMVAVGDAEWIDNEGLMDAVTAVSGSGPAYVFHLIETMTSAGITAGLSPALSSKLARQTVIGSAALAEKENATSAATLRQNVTSPGGTTEAALNVLMAENGLTALMTRAVQAAKQRGRDLAR
jgi:pyrroline-5-carboxylate reductase